MASLRGIEIGEGATPKAAGHRTPSRDTLGQAKLSTSNLGGGRILPETPACHQGGRRTPGPEGGAAPCH